ncbi:hypothetical protein A2U01_0114376, partial [Trifolium medium]|nr:hypothetical protein [Trifolium medium]
MEDQSPLEIMNKQASK